ncbi:DUF2946 family protein [Methylosinus sp. LW4]|uniref:DUF2946 family protein n=1 Tax=Methylosinus sp. LW4 TaxID=136993 RepID=UPI000365655D|nr:DUF2946 family protein [Methylosinus sp. LW4]
MAKLWAIWGRLARMLALSGIVALFLAQAVASARPDASSFGGSASLSSSDRLCRSAATEAAHDVADAHGGHTGGGHHCDSCPAICGGGAADAIVAPLRLGAALPHAPPAVVASRAVEAPARRRPGWRWSWSSRAPPLGA